MIDPLERWAHLGEKPDYAGLLSFGGAPYTQDPAVLADCDVAIVGAPMDDLVSDRPGARLAPRAIRGASCPPGPHLETEVDAFAELRIVDFGDAAVVPADPGRSHAAIEAIIGQVLGAGALPVMLGKRQHRFLLVSALIGRARPPRRPPRWRGAPGRPR